MHRTLPLVALLMGCNNTHFVFEHGGEVTLSLAPVDGVGVTVDATTSGDSADDLLAEIEGGREDPCDGARMFYGTSSESDEPTSTGIAMCAPEVPMTGLCDTPVMLSLDVDTRDQDLFLSMTPVSGPDLSSWWIPGDITLDPILESQGSFETVVVIDDRCVTEPTEHRLTFEWNFPEHFEKTTRSTYDPTVGIGAL
jgi:hypothetical protein